MDKSEGGGKTSDPLPRRGELHRCGSHEGPKASVRRKVVENHFFPSPGPVGSLPGGGGETRGGVQGRKQFTPHQAEVCQRFWCCRFRSG